MTLEEIENLDELMSRISSGVRQLTSIKVNLMFNNVYSTQMSILTTENRHLRALFEEKSETVNLFSSKTFIIILI